MGWLAHKFATAMQSGIFVIGSAIASGALIGGTTYDIWTEDADNITGANRNEMVQVFEGQIDDLKDIQASYEAIRAEHRLSIIKQEEPNVDIFTEKQSKSTKDFNALSSHVEREIVLIPNISEQDFIDLGEKYNDLFPLGKHKIDIDGGAYLHDAQLKYDMNITGSERQNLSKIIQSEMRAFLKVEEGGEKGNNIIAVAGMSAIATIIIGAILGGVSEESSSLKRLAKEPAPKSPLSKISDAMKKNRQKKIKNTRRIN